MSKLKKLVVGIITSYGPDFQQTPTRIRIPGYECLIVYNPKISIDHHLVDTAVDFLIEAGSTESVESPILRTLFGPKYLFIPRLDKNEILIRTKYAIPQLHTPGIYARIHGAGMSTTGIAPMTNRANIPKFVVKRDQGACGKNQALVPAHLIQDFLNYAECSLSAYQEKFPMVEFTGHHFSDSKDENTAYFMGDSLCVTEYLENITNEYRILVGGDDMIAYKRTRGGEGFIQANRGNPNERVHDDAVRVYKDLKHYFSAEHIEIIQEVQKVCSLHYGSIDVYHLPDNSLGIFECSPEFASAQTPPGIETRLLTGLLKWLIHKNT